MKQGKLTNDQLQKFIIDKITPKNAETVVGAGVGEDCCAVRLTDGLCVVSTDPITASSEQTGILAIHINANDIAAAGAKPIAALVTLLIPPSATEERISKVMQQLIQTAEGLGIDIIGGHTEVTDSVNRLIVSVTMIGKPVMPGRIFKTADMKVGEDIILTKYAALEGTSIIASDFAKELEGLLNEDDQKQLMQIGELLSVVKDGTIAATVAGVSAMHDVTEGGVIGALCEMCDASGTGAEVDFNKIPIYPITQKICDHYGIDVFGLISSGSMLITAQNGGAVIEALRAAGVGATVIGKVTEQGVFDISGGKRREIAPYRADELYKVLKTRSF
ncbi:MAG: AIR synthase family protein [Christensenella sp.]|uniref:AIR synthase family protein n=1 Tax=Christensenella sp. TaxID=1935934 RepID=UPI002B1F7B2B|nr:AIR synthase family protein [Christensenella sp.]MEA5002726.1 AIR synthase family protein [Christensenella sp.]